MLIEFKNWNDLPSTSEQFSGASACSVGASRVFVFGGAPFNREIKIESLDLNNVEKIWETIDITNFNPLSKINFYSACYLEEEKKIVAYGS